MITEHQQQHLIPFLRRVQLLEQQLRQAGSDLGHALALANCTIDASGAIVPIETAPKSIEEEG